MGRLGSTPADGCAPLDEHLLGAWIVFDDGLGLGDAPGKTPGVGVSDGATLGDGRTSAIGQGIADGISVGEIRAMAAAAVLTSGIDFGDAVERAWAAVRAISGGVRFSDSKLLGQMLLGEPLDQPDMAFVIGKGAEDGLALSDAIAHEWEAYLGLTDALSLRDAVAHGMGLVLSDGTSLSDSEALLLALALTLAARSGGLTLQEREP